MYPFLSNKVIVTAMILNVRAYVLPPQRTSLAEMISDIRSQVNYVMLWILSDRISMGFCYTSRDKIPTHPSRRNSKPTSNEKILKLKRVL